ncbi:hypothetical protein ONZ45_g6120 [Pleurotus djamor]|nr:hypothetical protein ONZ45_g6120 [Pleurotus djamor]
MPDVKVCHQWASSGTCNYGYTCKFAHTAATSQSNSFTSNRARKHTRSHRSSKKSANVLNSSASRFADFFSGYPEFPYNPNASVTDEFWRMCDYFNWKKDDPERQEAHEALKEALVLTFNEKYGTDENDVEAWKKLCRELRFNPIPDTLKACKEAVLATHVNLVDLVDNGFVHIFPSLTALQEYTRKGKYFPLHQAYAGGLLRCLLREIDSKYKGDRRRARGSDIRSDVDAALRRRR